MGFRGDLRAINLADMLQSMASRNHMAVLEIATEEVTWTVSIRNGAIVGVVSDPRRDIWDRLVRTGTISAEQLAEGRRRVRKKTPLAAVLINRGVVDAQVLRGFIEDFAYEQLFEILSLERGQVTLQDKVSFQVRDWMTLNVELPVASVVMEAARRSDHWEFARRHIAGPGTVLLPNPRITEQPESEIAQEILKRVGYDRTIGDVAYELPYSRTDVFVAAAELVKQGVLRPAGAEELVQIADSAEDMQGVVNALVQAHREEPANRQVLIELIDALEKAGRGKELPPYLKILANIYLENEQETEAVPCLQRLWELTPHDPWAAEKLLPILLKRKDLAGAESLGRALIVRYRKLGMHESWRTVAEMLLQHLGSRADRVADLGRAELAAGRRRRGTKLLHQAGQAFLDAGNLSEAETCYRELALITPKSKKIKEILEAIRKGTIKAKRRKRRKIATAVFFCFLVVASIFYTSYEAHARARFLKLTCHVLQEGTDTEEKITQAIESYGTFSVRYRGSICSFLDAKRIVKELQAKQAQLSRPASSAGSEAR